MPLWKTRKRPSKAQIPDKARHHRRRIYRREGQRHKVSEKWRRPRGARDCIGHVRKLDGKFLSNGAGYGSEGCLVHSSGYVANVLIRLRGIVAALLIGMVYAIMMPSHEAVRVWEYSVLEMNQ